MQLINYGYYYLDLAGPAKDMARIYLCLQWRRAQSATDYTEHRPTLLLLYVTISKWYCSNYSLVHFFFARPQCLIILAMTRNQWSHRRLVNTAEGSSTSGHYISVHCITWAAEYVVFRCTTIPCLHIGHGAPLAFSRSEQATHTQRWLVSFAWTKLTETGSS